MMKADSIVATTTPENLHLSILWKNNAAFYMQLYVYDFAAFSLFYWNNCTE